MFTSLIFIPQQAHGKKNSWVLTETLSFSHGGRQDSRFIMANMRYAKNKQVFSCRMYIYIYTVYIYTYTTTIIYIYMMYMYNHFINYIGIDWKNKLYLSIQFACSVISNTFSCILQPWHFSNIIPLFTAPPVTSRFVLPTNNYRYSPY